MGINDKITNLVRLDNSIVFNLGKRHVLPIFSFHVFKLEISYHNYFSCTIGIFFKFLQHLISLFIL